MPSVKMTNTIRDTIVEKLVKSKGLKEKVEAARLEEQKAADALLDCIYRPMQRHIDALPRTLFCWRNSCDVYIQDGDVETRYHVESTEARANAYFTSGSDIFTIRATEPEVVRWLEADKQFIKVRDEAVQIENKLQAFVRQFSTVNKLIEAWPEIVDIYPEITELATSSSKALTVQVDTVRKLMAA